MPLDFFFKYGLEVKSNLSREPFIFNVMEIRISCSETEKLRGWILKYSKEGKTKYFDNF